MCPRVLQINFKFHLSRADYEATVAPIVKSMAAVPGLLWAVWLINEPGREGGGLHLFVDRKSLDTYLDGEILADLVAHPALVDFSVRQFEVLVGTTTVTRGTRSTRR